MKDFAKDLISASPFILMLGSLLVGFGYMGYGILVALSQMP